MNTDENDDRINKYKPLKCFFSALHISYKRALHRNQPLFFSSFIMTRLWTNKKYKLDRSDNFEEFLRAIGINYFLRKMILASTIIIQLVDLEDGTFVLKQETTFKNMDLKFTPDVEFDDVKPNGAVVKTVMTFESENVLIHKQVNPPAEFRRVFKEDELEMVSKNTLKFTEFLCILYMPHKQ